MSRHVGHEASAEPRGMKRSTRMSMIAGVAVFLTLVSGVSFAAWTASSSKNATASAGAVAVTTATSGGAATITALGPFTYTSSNQTVTKPITVRNTGTVEATVSSIAITRSGTLGGNQIAVKFWAGTSAACTVTTPVVSSNLSGGTVSLTTLGMTIAASSSAFLCASTTFTGTLATQAGKSIAATFAVNTSAGTNWTATDNESAANRSFTQSISALAAPTNMQCSTQSIFFGAYYEADISWTAPSAAQGTTLTYEVYIDYGAGPVLIDTVASTAITITRSMITGNGSISVRAVANGATQSAPSVLVPVKIQNGWYAAGVACG